MITFVSFSTGCRAFAVWECGTRILGSGTILVWLRSVVN